MYDTVLEFVADRVGVVFRVLATGGGGGVLATYILRGARELGRLGMGGRRGGG